MSQLKRRQKRSHESMESDKEIPESVVNTAVKSILILDKTKKPIKQSDILNCLQQKVKRKDVTELWKAVRVALDNIGMRLVDIVESQTKSFFVVTARKAPDFLIKFASPEEKSFRTLLFLVLAFILMSDDVVREDELVRHLKSLSILNDSGDPHEYFGDVKKKVFTEFVEQLYLTRAAAPENKELLKLSWGPRAKIEVNAVDVLRLVCHTAYNGKVDPEQWVSQFKTASEHVAHRAPDESASEEEDDDE